MSSIDRSSPANDSALLSPLVRANFNAAANDIDALNNTLLNGVVHITGAETITGKKTMPGGVAGLPAPVNTTDAARKIDVDTVAATVTGAAAGRTPFATLALMNADSTHSGFATVYADPTPANNRDYYRATTGVAWASATNQTDVETARALAAEAAISASIPTLYANLAAALAAGGISVINQIGGLYADTYAKGASLLSLLATKAIGLPGLQIEQKKALESAPFAVPSWPVMPILEVAPIDALAFNGILIPNRQQPLPERNLFPFPWCDTIVGGGGAVTPNFAADPWGGTTAARIHITASGYVQLEDSFSFPITPGDYRIECFVKSNSGAGASSVSVNNAAGGGTTISTTEGAWVPVSLGYTLGAHDSIYFNYPGSAADVLVAGLRITPTQVTLGAGQPVGAVGSVVQENFMAPGVITPGAGNSFVSPYKGRIRFMPDGVTQKSFAAMTMILSLKCTDSAGGFSEMFFSKDPINVLALGVNNTMGPGEGFHWKMPGLDVAWGLPLIAGWVILALRFDATRSDAHFGSVPIGLTGTGTGTGGTPLTIASAYFGGAGYIDAYPMGGFGGPMAIFDSYLSDTALQQAVAHLRSEITLYGNAMGARSIHISEGDSITFGVGASDIFHCWSQLTATFNNIQRVNYAVPGSALPNLQSRLPQVLTAIKAAVADGLRPIVTVMVGVNSIPLMSDLIAYWNALRGAGAYVIACTVTSSNLQSPANTDSYNAAIRAEIAAENSPTLVLADVGANANMGGDGAYANTTYFGDGLHPTNTGHALIATIVEPVMAALLV